MIPKTPIRIRTRAARKSGQQSRRGQTPTYRENHPNGEAHIEIVS